MRVLVLMMASAIALSAIPTAHAGSTMTGGTFMKIEDGSKHACINVNNHLVSISLVSAQVQRSQSWWDVLLKAKSGLGVKFDVIIQNQSGTPFNFPRAKQLAVSSTRSDIGFLPMKFSVMSKYSLVGLNKDPYVNLELGLYLITLETASSAFKDMMALINFSSSLPLPPNPYTSGVEYFGKFAQQIVDQNLQNGDEKLPVAFFSFDLPTDDSQASDANCPAQALRDGVQAVMFDYEGAMDDSMISSADSSKYCYWYVANSSRIVFSGRPPRNADCASSPPSGTKPLNNPLVAFIVPPWPAPGVATPSAADIVATNHPSPTSNNVTQTAINSLANLSLNDTASVTHGIDPKKVKGIFDTLTAQPGSPST